MLAVHKKISLLLSEKVNILNYFQCTLLAERTLTFFRDVIFLFPLQLGAGKVFLQVCCKFTWAKWPVAAILLIHARQKFAKTRIDNLFAFSVYLYT